jgi:hypothetical protein
MHEYEIRVLNNFLSTSLVMQTMQLSDHAAIRAGRKIADGEPFEVWQDIRCVYGADAAKPLPFPIRRPAA